MIRDLKNSIVIHAFKHSSLTQEQKLVIHVEISLIYNFAMNAILIILNKILFVTIVKINMHLILKLNNVCLYLLLLLAVEIIVIVVKFLLLKVINVANVLMGI